MAKTTTYPKVDQEDVHNYHVGRARTRITETYPAEIVEMIKTSWVRHHQEGTDARVEAAAINRRLETMS